MAHNVDGQSRLEYPIGKTLYQSGGWISNIRIRPDGDEIAFMDHPAPWDDRGTVRVVDMSGQVKVLTHEWDSESGLAWRHDGEEIWFTAIEKGSSLGVFAVNRSGKLRGLLDLPMGITLQDIARDGRLLVTMNSKRLAMGYTAAGSRRISSSRTTTGTPRVTFLPTVSSFCLRIPVKRRGPDMRSSSVR